MQGAYYGSSQGSGYETERLAKERFCLTLQDGELHSLLLEPRYPGDCVLQIRQFSFFLFYNGIR